ncbi:MAG: hypothetical protein K0Q46_2546 [Rhodococcus erythropolis]|nr:hypothetical protein [Rhodococcus erythropolis]MDF2895760.1 hypothetical protein [Rhodococcus erythropolis]
MAIPPFLAFDATTKLPPKSAIDALRTALGIRTTTTRLAVFGDSMSALTQGGYAPYGSLVADYLGLALFNPSTPGERTSDIAVRQGGLAPKFTVPGGVIPIDTSEFAVTLAESYTSGYSPAATTKGNIGTFLNVSFLGVPVNLYHVNNAWTMARVTAAAGSSPQPVAVPASGAVVRDIASAAWRNAVQVYMGGFNGGEQVKDVTTMSAYLENPGRFVVLGMSTGSSGGDPTPYKAANAALKTAFPDQFFDMAAYVITNGLTDEGITPTAQDNTDIAAGIVPTSLRRASNDPHYNAAGQRVIARRLAELLIERGFVAAASTNRIPARAVPGVNLILSLPSTTSVASVAPNSALQGADALSVRLIDMTIPSVTAASGYRALASRWQSGSGNWQFLLASDGTLFMQDANGPVGEQSTPIAPANGVISLRLDINRAAGTMAFYTSTNSGATWTQRGTTTTGRSTTNALSGNSTALLRVGATSAYPAVAGSKLKRITILDGSGATLVNHDFTVTDTEGWTYAGDAAIISA